MTEALTFKKDQLYRQLREGIDSGLYARGAKLPGELEFSRQLGVGKVTLRSALERLEKEGAVARVPGKGTFVTGGVSSRHLLILMTRGTDLEMPKNYILPGIVAAAGEFGFTSEECYIENLRKLGEKAALEILRSKNICGAVLISSSCRVDDPEIVMMHKLNVPCVITHGHYNDRLCNLALLYTNLRQAFRSALEFLASKGHEQVKVIGFRGQEVRDYRFPELPELFHELGFENKGKLVYSAQTFTREAIRRAIDEMLADGLPTAVMAFSDFFAIDIMEYLQEKGFRVPQDVAVMGFCGFPGGTFLRPSLSTVDFHYSAIGRNAVRLIADAGNWFGIPGVTPPVIASPFDLVERASTDIVRCEKQLIAMEV